MAVPAKNIHELYVAYWGRAADPDGLAYWLAESQKEGVTLEVIAKSFSDQAEAQAAYPLLKDPTLVNDPVAREAFLTQVYQNLLGRAPDAAGLAYWSDVLAAGGKDAVGRIIIDIVGGAQGDDAQLIANKVAVSDSFASAADKAGLDHTSNGLLDAANGALNGVTKDPASVDAANQANQGAIDQIAGDINSQTISLTTGLDNLTGTDFADLFTARVVQNGNGEQTNQLATGDQINGGDSTDTLNATVQSASALNNTPASGIALETVDVEVANFTALDANESDIAVLINAKFMNGLDEVGSIQSDVDLIVQNLNTLTDSGVYTERRNTEELTIRFDHGGNDATIDPPADLVALFDNDYLLSDSSNTSTLELRMVNNLTLADDNQPLVNVDAVSFFVGTVEVVTTITDAMQALTGDAAYNAVVAAIEARLTALGISDVTVVTLAERTTVFSDDLGNYLQGSVAGLYRPILITSAGDALAKGQTNVDNTTTDFNGLNTQTTQSSTAENPIEVGVELLKVGRGGEGGELVIGGMATDMLNNWNYTDNALEEGIEVFNVGMEGDRTQFSSLAGLYSTNNTLDTVNVTWAVGSRADLIIGNQNTINNRSVTVDVAPNSAASNAEDGFNTVTTVYNNALKDVRVFTAANNGVTAAVGSTAAISTDVTLWATLSGEVVAKYMDRTDIDAPAADNANFAYTFGAGNDTLNLNISEDNLAASGTSGREDFSMAISTGAGDDTVVVQIGDGKAGATTPWYVNTTIQDNLSIATGTGADTVHANGAGAWIINTGDNNDAIYSDNSGRQVIDSNGVTADGEVESTAVWVFNTANQAQTGAGSIQNLFDLTSASAVADVLKVANLDLTVSFRGINVTVEVGDTHSSTGDTVNDLTINQAIKDAINNDVYLSKLLSAQDGPGRTLIVTALTDGVFSNADISVSVANPTALSIAQTGAGAAYLTGTQLTALGLTSGSAVANGRFDSAIAEDSNGAGSSITGAVSVQANQNNITAGLGNDTVVLSTSLLAKETVNVAAAGGTAATDSDVVFNASAGSTITVDAFDTVITSAGVRIFGGVGAVTVLANLIEGTANNDTITAAAATVGQGIDGKAGNDIITGSAFADTITGGLGGDKMNGGAGADKFVIGNLDSGLVIASADEITGFVTTSDTLSLGTAGSTGAPLTDTYSEAGGVVVDFTAALAAANTALATLAGTSAATELYAFQWDASNGYLFNDTDGNGTADQVIVLVGITGGLIEAADIVV